MCNVYSIYSLILSCIKYCIPLRYQKYKICTCMVFFLGRPSSSRIKNDIFSFGSLLLKGKNLLIPAAAGFFSLDATSGLLATVNC